MTIVLILAAWAALSVVAGVFFAIRLGMPAKIRDLTAERDALLQAIYSWAYSTSYVGADRELEDRRLYGIALEMATEAGWEPPTAEAQGPAK